MLIFKISMFIFKIKILLINCCTASGKDKTIVGVIQSGLVTHCIRKIVKLLTQHKLFLEEQEPARSLAHTLKYKDYSVYMQRELAINIPVLLLFQIGVMKEWLLSVQLPSLLEIQFTALIHNNNTKKTIIRNPTRKHFGDCGKKKKILFGRWGGHLP